MIGYIYKHTARNGKSYIGQTYNSRGYLSRWRNGNGYENNTIIGRAINKYGWDSFEHTILHTVDKDDITDLINELNRLEEKEIIDNNTITPYGYNGSYGGCNRQVSLITKNKQSAIAKKRYLNGEIVWNKGLSKELQPRYGKKQSSNQKEIARSAMINSWKSGKITGHKVGVFKHSEETKKKISLIQFNYSEDKKKMIREKINNTMMERYGKKRMGSSCMSGKKWFTNGTDNFVGYECPIGFIAGRTLTEETKTKISKTVSRLHAIGHYKNKNSID